MFSLNKKSIKKINKNMCPAVDNILTPTTRRQCIPIIYTKGTHYDVGFDTVINCYYYYYFCY